MNKELNDILIRLRDFVKERDWSQFHNSKDLAIAISIEANELLEHFLWKQADAVTKEKISHEIADVFIYCLMLCDKLDIDIVEAINKKIDENAIKYPVQKAKGNAIKWSDL